MYGYWDMVRNGQMDRRIDGQTNGKKRHIEVGVPPKNQSVLSVCFFSSNHKLPELVLLVMALETGLFVALTLLQVSILIKNLTRNLSTIHQLTTPQVVMMNQVMKEKIPCVILVLTIYLMEHLCCISGKTRVITLAMWLTLPPLRENLR